MAWLEIAIGLFVGLALARLFDWLYWRNRRVCSDREVELQAMLDRSEAQNAGLMGEIDHLQAQTERVSRLQADLDARTAQYNGLLADVDVRKQREAALTRDLAARDSEIKSARAIRTRMQDADSQLSERDAELAKLRTRYESRGAQLSGLTAKVSDLEAKLTQRDAQIESLSAEITSTRNTRRAAIEQAKSAAVSQPEPTPVVNTVVRDSAETPPAPATTTQSQPSDLGMIWGVNEEVNTQLHANGIYTYDQLANSRASDVDSALTVASRYYPGMDRQAIHGSWIKQADLAIAGQWDDLSNYQHETIDLASGRDDLKVIWGIGPKIEGVMNENGIYTFAQVASVPAERLTEILHKAGPRFRISSEKLHETWPEQARLADRGEMEALAALQAGLSKRTG